MKKFVVMYRVPVETMQQWRKNTPPEEMKAQGQQLEAEMMAWTKKHESALVDKGMPLGKNTRLTAAGAMSVPNDLNYYCVVEAESAEQIAEMFKDNPHLQIPDSYIDVMEVPHFGM
jgi:hypothetical protein